MKRIMIFIMMLLFSISFVSAYIPQDNLVAWWTFDNLSDSSGNGQTLTNFGATSTSSNCRSGSCYDFDGLNDYMSFTAHSSFPDNDDSRTICNYAYHGSTSDNEMYLSYGTSGAKKIYSHYRKGISRYFSVVDDSVVYSDESAVLQNITGYFLCGVYNSANSTIRYYRDGVHTGVDNVGYAFLTTTSTMNIGRQISAANYMNGRIDEMTVFNTTLSDDDILSLYQNGIESDAKVITIEDASLVNNTFTNSQNINISVNLSVSNTNGLVNTTLYLNNGSSYQIGTETLNMSYTLEDIQEGIYELWVYAENNETSATSENYTYTFDFTPPTYEFITNDTEVNSFAINFTETFLNISYGLSGFGSCFINITELSNVTTPDSFLIACSELKTFSSAGLHSAYAFFADNALNVNDTSFNFTINPYISVNFLDVNDTNITNYDYRIFHPDGRVITETGVENPVLLSPVNNGSLDLGSHIVEFSKLGYDTVNVTVEINETSGGEIYNFTVPASQLFFEFVNLEDGTFIEGGNVTTVNIIGDQYSTTFSTNESNYTLISLEIVSDTYQILVSNSEYDAVNTLLTFTNQEILNFTIYMTPKTPQEEVVADLIIEVVDKGGSIQEDIPVYQYVWDVGLLQDVLVNQKETSSNGQTSFSVFLDTRSYTFCAEYNNELHCEADKVIGVNTVKEVIEIDTDLIDETPPNDIYSVDFPFGLTNTTNPLDNTSLLLFTWANSAQGVDEYCLVVYERVNSKDVSVYDECSVVHSANLGHTVDLETGNSYTAKAYIIVDGETRIIDTLTINVFNVLEDALEPYGFHKLIALVIFIFGLVIGLSRKVHNITISHIGVSLAYLFISILFPSLFGLDVFFVILLLNVSAVLLITKRDDISSKPAIRNILSILFVYIVMIFALNFLLGDFDDRGLLDDRGEELYNYLNNAEDGENTELGIFLESSENQLNQVRGETSPSGEDKTDNTLTTFIKLVSFVDTFFILLSKVFSIPTTLYYMLGYTTTFLTGLMVYINWVVNVMLIKIFYDSVWGK